MVHQQHQHQQNISSSGRIEKTSDKKKTDMNVKRNKANYDDKSNNND